MRCIRALILIVLLFLLTGVPAFAQTAAPPQKILLLFSSSPFLLAKAGFLEDDEFNEMKYHPLVGAEILREIDFLAPSRIL